MSGVWLFPTEQSRSCQKHIIEMLRNEFKNRQQKVTEDLKPCNNIDHPLFPQIFIDESNGLSFFYDSFRFARSLAQSIHDEDSISPVFPIRQNISHPRFVRSLAQDIPSGLLLGFTEKYRKNFTKDKFS